MSHPGGTLLSAHAMVMPRRDPFRQVELPRRNPAFFLLGAVTDQPTPRGDAKADQREIDQTRRRVRGSADSLAVSWWACWLACGSWGSLETTMARFHPSAIDVTGSPALEAEELGLDTGQAVADLLHDVAARGRAAAKRVLVGRRDPEPSTAPAVLMRLGWDDVTAVAPAQERGMLQLSFADGSSLAYTVGRDARPAATLLAPWAGRGTPTPRWRVHGSTGLEGPAQGVYLTPAALALADAAGPITVGAAVHHQDRAAAEGAAVLVGYADRVAVLRLDPAARTATQQWCVQLRQVVGVQAQPGSAVLRLLGRDGTQHTAELRAPLAAHGLAARLRVAIAAGSAGVGPRLG